MSRIGTALDCTVASRRLAEAQSISELEREWKNTQRDFQSSWERKGHKLVMMVHDEYAGIGDADVAEILATINSASAKEPIDVIIHTRGGSASGTMQIAEALVDRPKTATFIPFSGRSGGTMIALATEKIHLAKGAALGPLDLQFGDMPAHELIQIVEELGDQATPGWKSRAREAKLALSSHVEDVCARINRKHKGLFGWRGCTLAKTLTDGHMLHGKTINYTMAKRLHMQVVHSMPKSVFKLVGLRLEQLRRLRELQSEVKVVEKRVAPSHHTSRPVSVSPSKIAPAVRV